MKNILRWLPAFIPVVALGCTVAEDRSLPVNPGRHGQLYLLSTAPSGKTHDGQRVTRIDLTSRQQSVLYESNEPYSMDPEQSRVVGYLPTSHEVVLRAWDEEQHSTLLLAHGPTSQRRVLAKFADKWVADVSSLGYGLGVILAEERPRITWMIQGSEAVLVHTDGSITPILRNAQMGIAGGVTCSTTEECVLSINVEPCSEDECSKALVAVSNGQERTIDGVLAEGPCISPDGRWIAAVTIEADGPSRYQIFDLEKHSLRASLGLRPVGGAAWSPDGTMFAHSSGVGPPSWMLGVWEVSGKKIASFKVPYRSQILAFGNEQ